MAGRLKRTWERTRTVPGLGRDVTAIVALVLAGTLVAGGILAKQRVHWPWQDEFTFRADFRETPGISPGNGQEVRIAGVTVGRIKEAKVSGDGRARLTLAIDPDYEVYKDARLVLRPKTPLNDMYVEMSQGTAAAGELDEDGMLPVAQTDNPVQVDEVLGHLDERTRNALTSLLGEADAALAHAPGELAPGLDAGTELLRTFKPVVTSLEKRRDTIASLITALSTIAKATGTDDERLSRLVGSLDTTLSTLARRGDSVRAALRKLPGTTSELANATSEVTALSEQLDPTLRSLQAASGELPDALDDLGELSGSLKQTAVLAQPVVADLRPVVANLRPFVADLAPTMNDAAIVTGDLDRITAMLVSRLTDLQAFVYNTASMVSLQDASGGILRGQIQANATTLGLPEKRSN